MHVVKYTMVCNSFSMTPPLIAMCADHVMEQLRTRPQPEAAATGAVLINCLGAAQAAKLPACAVLASLRDLM